MRPRLEAEGEGRRPIEPTKGDGPLTRVRGPSEQPPSLDRSRTDRLLPMRVVVPWDRVALGLELPVLPGRPLPNPVVRARELQAALARHGTAAGLARAYGVTRASVCQYLTLLRRLPPEVLEEVEGEKDQAKLKRASLRRLLRRAGAQT